MDKGLDSKRKFKSLIAGVKRINETPNSLLQSTSDKYADKLASTKGVVNKSINDFTSKLKGRTENMKDVFGDLLETVDGFLGSVKEDPVNPKKKPLIKSKTLEYAKKSAQIAMDASKNVIVDEVKNNFFSGQGTCDPNTTIPESSYTLSPKSFDLTNMLKVNPTSTSGKLMYEALQNPETGMRFNTKLYNKFDDPSIETIYKKDGTTLFDIEWNPSTQLYTISGMGSGMKINNFISDYYDTIEQPNIGNVMTSAMLMTLQGDGTEGSSFNVGSNLLERLSTKLCSICGNSSNDDSPFLNNAAEQFNEDEVDVQDYFNFDDVEGIDLDDEDARNRRVLKFTDCNNFEIPTNSNHIEDFAYLLGSKNIDENIKNTLNKVASDAYEQSDNSIHMDGFQLSIMSSLILKMPRAIISNVLSPKVIFPIALVFQMLSDEIISIVELMKRMATMFFKMITKLFWRFIKEFWGFIKKDLLVFVATTAAVILLNKVKRHRGIILALIAILLKVLKLGIKSCADMFNALLQTLKSALNKKVKIPIPGLLLVLSERLPGFSSDRAFMGALEKMEASGINTGPIYGSENKLPSVIKGIIDGYSSEVDDNSYIKIALNPAVIPAGPGSAIISPLVTGTGKMF